MKPSQLKKWGVFLNSSGKPCMVVHDGHGQGQLKILSMSGSIYDISRGGNQNYMETDMTAQEFVDKFPLERLNGNELNKRIFNLVKAKIKQNETIGITPSNGDRKSTGGIAIPTGERQIATGSRPIGNTVSFRIKAIRITPTEIRACAITC